ncbi:hypothetical protein ACMHYB_44025 [Sorangium sp. So ce1128]
MVEAVVVVPFFIMIFVALLFVGSLYKEKLRVMRLAKQSAWMYAMANCGESGDPLTSRMTAADDAIISQTSEICAVPADPKYSDAMKAGGDQAGLASKRHGFAEARMASSVNASGGLGGVTKGVTGHARVMCNEPPYNGNLSGFLKAGWNALTNW